MDDFSNWIWLVVAGIWLVTRVLPRLFRARSRDAAPPLESEPDIEQELAVERFGRSDALRGTPAPRPIEPR